MKAKRNRLFLCVVAIVLIYWRAYQRISHTIWQPLPSSPNGLDEVLLESQTTTTTTTTTTSQPQDQPPWVLPTKINELPEHGHSNDESHLENQSRTRAQTLVQPHTETEKSKSTSRNATVSMKPNKRASAAKTTSRGDEGTKNDNFLEYHKVVVLPGEAFMWKGSQQKLCKRITKEQKKYTNTTKRTLLLLGAPCKELHRQHRHGNLVLGLYAMHVAALAHGNVDFVFGCKERRQADTVFWWMQNRQLSDLVHTRKLLQASPSLYQPAIPPIKSACKGMGRVPLYYASELAKFQFRRMAIAMFGTPTKVAREFASEHHLGSITPLRSTSTLDQVAIHFRCGDVLSGLSPKVNDNYGMVPFSVYRDVIQNHNNRTGSEVSTIGIVTAPFDPKHLRSEDAKFSSACEEIASALDGYLSQNFPRAKVSIRNSHKDTIPMVFARLVLADLTFCIRSTFCLFPVLSTFGEGMLLEGGVTRSLEPVAHAHPNVHLLNASNIPYLLSHEIQAKGRTRVIDWLLGKEDVTT